MFLVKAGTKARVIKDRKEWVAPNIQDFTTTKDSIFDKHEVRVDPVGRLGAHRGLTKTIGGAYAAAGYYAFKPENSIWIIIVHINDVEYLN